MLVRSLSIGVCGTDVEIVQGRHGNAPAGRQRLILGHESLGEVVEAPEGELSPGDLVVGVVRRPDPLPCRSCAIGEWDMCRDGRYTECGIEGRDGFGSEMFRIEPALAVRVSPSLGRSGVLLEPASVVAKAWEQIERIGGRAAAWEPRSVLITGAGPVGLLAALMGAQRGLEVHVFDRATDGAKPRLARDLGATYHAGSLRDVAVRPDVVIECTGASPVICDVLERTAPVGIVCLAGLSSRDRSTEIDLERVARTMVLENDVVFGTVNANRRHYEAAARSLEAADKSWLERLVTRRVPLHRWQEAFERGPDDVKVVIEVAA